MNISKIELLENELEKNEAKIDLLQCECNALWDELDVIHQNYVK